MQKKIFMRYVPFLAIFFVVISTTHLFGQENKELMSVSSSYALKNVNIIQSPKQKIDRGTVIIKAGLITDVGKSLTIPSDAIIIDADSMYVYAGFIDGMTHAGIAEPKKVELDKPKDPGNPSPERAGITPQNDVVGSIHISDKTLVELRNSGFTVAQVVPYGNFLPGHASIIFTGGTSDEKMVLQNKSALYSELKGVPKAYPATVLGVMAKWRELYRQAAQTKNYEKLYSSNRRGLERPIYDPTLQPFYPVIDLLLPVLIKTENIVDVSRALNLKNDLQFKLIIADIKQGWPLINEIKLSGAKVFLSLDLPDEIKKKDDKTEEKDKPKQDTIAIVEKKNLESRRAESVKSYTSQAATFEKAGISFGFSSMSAKSGEIQSNLRRMVEAGLSEETALASLTTVPAEMLGLSDLLGTIEKGKIANLVVTKMPYFADKSEIKYVFVDGVLHKTEVKSKKCNDEKINIEGTWSTVTKELKGSSYGKLIISKVDGKYLGKFNNENSASDINLSDFEFTCDSLKYSYKVNISDADTDIKVAVKINGCAFSGTANAGKLGSFTIEGKKNP